MIRRKTTPSFTFTIQFSTDLLEEVQVIFSQPKNHKLCIVKETDDCTFSGTNIVCSLSAEETLEFKEGYDTYIQLWARKTTGACVTSDMISIDVYNILYDEVPEDEN